MTTERIAFKVDGKIAEAIPMPQGEYELLMQSGRHVSISRTYKNDFEKSIGL
jgi:hypothetical protein